MTKSKDAVLVAMILAVIVLAVLLWYQKSAHDKKILAANNELAAYIPLQRISDSLQFKVVRLSNDLGKEITKSSRLRRAIKERDQKILALASAKVEAKIESVIVPIQKEGSVAYFDTTSRWFAISGFVDSLNIRFANIALEDSLSFVVTKSASDVVYGYVENHSPYVRVTNADFALDVSRFIEKQSDWWKYGALAGLAYFLATIVKSLL